MGAMKLTVPLSDIQVVGAPKPRPMPPLDHGRQGSNFRHRAAPAQSHGREAMLKLDILTMPSWQACHRCACPRQGTGARNAVGSSAQAPAHRPILAEQCGGTGATVEKAE